MSEKRVFLVEVKTLEPVVIASNKGKSKFVESLSYIPASSILGALARKAVLENIASDTGECSKISSLSTLPACNSCDIENCTYRLIWIEKNVKLTNAMAGKWNIDAPGVPNLLSIGERRDTAGNRDLLLCLFVEREERKGKLPPNLLLDRDKNSLNYKRRPMDIMGREICGVNKGMIQFGRVTIDPEFKTSKEGELYGFTAIRDGQKFRFTAVADEEVRDFFNCKIKVGAWKSRGMGLIEMNIVGEWKIEDYIKKRSGQILSGFEKINEILRDYRLDGWYGTYTFLTDHTDIKLNPKFKIHRIRKIRRYERRADGEHFILRDVVSVGSAGVFSVDEPEETSLELAEKEIEFVEEPWFNWVFFNHPVHYEKSSLRG